MTGFKSSDQEHAPVGEVDTSFVHMLPTPRAASVSGTSKRRRQSVPRRQEQRRIGHVHVMSMKERVQIFLDGPIGVALEIFNILLSMVLVIIAVVQSYDKEEIFPAVSTGYNKFELACNIFFTVDFLLHLYAAEDRGKFARSPMGIIDIITIAPTYITQFFLQAAEVGIVSIIRIIRIFRMLTVLRLYRIVQSYRGVDYELGVLLFMIFTVIFVAAGVMQELDRDYYADNGLPAFEFHHAVYFVFVTISTVGYGDISPKSTISQLFVILMICVVVTVIPRQIQQLVELSKLQHGYMHSYAVRKRSGGHVIITGSINFESVSSFLSEFYRPRQGKVNMDVVILADQVPSERLLVVLRNVRYHRRVTYLKGSLLNDKDAKRVHVEAAAAVFILADKKIVKHAEAADALTILQALAVDKFKFRNEASMVKRSNGGSVRCFLQVLSPQRTRGLRSITGVEVALNTPRLRTAILARSVLCPGATALLLNLVCSLKETHVGKALASSVPWIAEYSHGLQHQLYPVILPAFFDAMTYEKAALQLYTHFSVILVAAYDRFAGQVGAKRIRIAPFGHVLRENDLVFVIALSASDAQHAVNAVGDRPSTAKHRPHSQQQYKSAAAVPPTLVFSSDSVLDRQSMVRDRSESIELSSDDESVVAELDEQLHAQDADVEIPTQPVQLPPFLQHRHSIGGSITDWCLPPHALRKLQDHIIICGPFAHGNQLAHYLDELYACERRGSQRPPILLLVKRLPTESDFANATPLPENVFVEKGVSQNVEDLLHVRAYVARAVLMIPGNWKFHVDELRDETSDEVNEHLLDYQVIMSTLSLRTVQDLHTAHLRSHPTSHSHRATPTLTCSVVKWHESVAYFAHKSHAYQPFSQDGESGESNGNTVQSIGSWFYKSQVHHGDHRHRAETYARNVAHQQLLYEFPKGPSPLFSPSYAAGEVFVDGVLDTLLCQSFFNPYAIDLVRAIAGDYYYTDHHSHSTPQNFVTSMMAYFQGQPLTQGDKPTAAKAEDNTTTQQHPVLTTATVASELLGQSFATVFTRALAQQVLVLAIYRRPNDPRRGNALPYVFTCPKSSPDVTLERGDTLHVLAKGCQPICIR